MTRLDWLERQELWLTPELLNRGLTTATIAALARQGELVRLRRGCYQSSERWKTLTTDGQQVLQVVAHRAVGASLGNETPVYSHTSAARLHGLYLLNPDLLIHITQSSSVSPTSHARDVRKHQGWLTAPEVTQRRGLLVTSLERTVVDCSRILQYRQGLVTAEHALRLGASREGMKRVTESLVNHKGIRNARRVIANASHLSESPGETLTLDTMRSQQIPMPEQQVWVSSRLGDYRLDFAWRELRAAMEFDGRIKYFDYQPTSQVLFEERRREKALVELGWTILRIEWSDLFREAELKARILTHLRRAEARRAA
ncbi:very-short-patch-repair endonuclease [Arthrobacter sp. CAN_A212]|uniref:type IV toxin-antitoxin system AbiEi family antitoxin domain-containing protein n=1 Tax=Arthrobacter sp. CAN_A212 TaxID=2787719 RepID=UPI0018CAFA87